MNVNNIFTNLELRDGIWYSKQSKEISYPSKGNQDCFQIEENSFWFKHRNNCILEAVKKYSPNNIFFDVGGGNGFVSKHLQANGIESVLVEPGSNGAANAKERGLKNIICSTLEEAGFKKEVIKSIGMFDVVEHIKDHVAFLKSANSALAKNGIIYLTVPAYNFLWSKEDVDAGHFRRYTLKSMAKVLSETGFNPIYSTYIFSILPFPIYLFRSIPSKLGMNKNSDSLEKHQNEHQNNIGIVDSILSKELSAIKKGKSIPFGSSCFVVAKKIIS